MTFLTERELERAIRELPRKRRWWCAVAFWGKGADRLWKGVDHKNVRLICNLSMGGTNPNVIGKAANTRKSWKQHPTLHAKVYLGDDIAIVTSANASANGLGLEDGEVSGWLEAGVLINDAAQVERISDWFDNVWATSSAISDVDLMLALKKWKERQKARPTLRAFADFDPAHYGHPMLSWEPVVNSNWTTNRNAVVSALGSFSDAVNKQILDGVDIDGDKDRKLLKPGKWILTWPRTEARKRSSRSKLRWIYTGALVKNAGAYDDSDPPKDAVLSLAVRPPIPFDPNEKKFLEAFDTLLNNGKYSFLKADSENDWFFPRLSLMKKFWVDLKVVYLKKGS